MKWNEVKDGILPNNMDKKKMMDRYGWDMILDYYPRRKRHSVQKEIDEFLMLATPFIPNDVLRQFSAITYEAKDILFGKGKSHSTKFKEILTIMRVSDKTALGVLDVLRKEFKHINEKQDVKSLNK